MKAKVRDLEGNVVREIELPDHFEEEVREDLIKKAVLAAQSHRYQPKGVKEGAGRGYTAEYVGRRRIEPSINRVINTGHARLPHSKQHRFLLWGPVRNVPQAVKGPRAHPPKVEKNIRLKINRKERRRAIRSAIAATAVPEYVTKKHRYEGELPIVVVDDLEEMKKTKDVVRVFEKIGVLQDVEHARERKRWRAGKGKMRGRRYKRKKSVLVVVSKDKGIYRAARNLEGVEVVEVRNLNAELLAPGTHPGRLVVWTEGAIKELEHLFRI